MGHSVVELMGMYIYKAIVTGNIPSELLKIVGEQIKRIFLKWSLIAVREE